MRPRLKKKKAYYKLSLKHHPDKNPDPESKKLFVKIANAYQILKDEATREQYDYAIAHPEERLKFNANLLTVGSFNIKPSFFRKFDYSSAMFSSLGSLDEKWMAELATTSMSAGMTENKKPLGLGKPLIVWPSVEDVRCSIEGYAAGNAVPSPLKNVEKEFLKKYWAKWKSSHTGHCRASYKDFHTL